MRNKNAINWLPKSVLILAPHTDDGEFGCGGTIAKLIEAGSRVIYIAFSAAESSVQPEFQRDILRKEVKHAVANLGLNEKDLLVLNYEVRRFNEFRQKILDDLIHFKTEYNPDAVFLPSLNDTHQDHTVITQEGFRAFKMKTMFGYELPWNNLSFKTSNFFVLTQEQLEKKIQALLCYESQKNRSYTAPDFIRSLARVRGTQIGEKYAESFELIRWVVS